MSHPKETLVREGQHGFKPDTIVRKILLVVIAFVVFFIMMVYLPLKSVPQGCDPVLVKSGLAILVLAGILWLTEALPLAITALLIPVAASLSGVMDVSESFSGFSHPLIFLFLGGFGLAAALSRQQLDRWLAMRIMVIGRGKFNGTALVLFTVSAMLSMWISNTATVAILLPVALGILGNISKQCGQDMADQAAPYLLLGIAYSASIGGIGTLIGTPPNAIAAAQLKMSFVDWLKVGIPCMVVLLPLLFLLLRILSHPGKVPSIEVKKEEFNFDVGRVVTLIVFLGAIIAWLFSWQISEFLGIHQSFDTLVAIIAVVILASLKLVRWKDIDRMTDWGVLLLFGGGITLSRVLSSTGASQFLASQIQHYTFGWPVIVVIAAVVLFMIFLTELSSNTASAALLIPIFAAVSFDMGVSVTELVLPLTIAASCAFMLPIATPPNAIVFASGKIKQHQMIRVGFALNIVYTIVLTLLSRVLF